MIPHHEEAIVAARELAGGTNRMAMRRFANSIVQTQTAEANQMRRWLAAWYPDTRVTYQPMMRDLTQLRGDAIDRAHGVTTNITTDLFTDAGRSILRSRWLLAWISPSSITRFRFASPSICFRAIPTSSFPAG
jgi:hypothetical protein